LETKAQF